MVDEGQLVVEKMGQKPKKVYKTVNATKPKHAFSFHKEVESHTYLHNTQTPLTALKHYGKLSPNRMVIL